jgi:nucleoside 2-deoxyribosyltransferase
MIVYLAGPIFGCTDAEAKAWRRDARRLLEARGHGVSDPMDRDYRREEAGNEEAIVDGDLRAIAESDAVLVSARWPSWGTAMEIVYAHHQEIPVAAFTTKRPLSPWLTYHADVYPTLEAAVEALCS